MIANYYFKGNLVLNGTIHALSGLHIGASNDTVEIGGIDSPVIKNPVTGAPYIPGSSLKGKMRHMMEKVTYSNNGDFEFFNRSLGSGNSEVNLHVCDDALALSYSKDNGTSVQGGAISCPVCRMFGTTAKGDGNANFPARLIFRDCNLVNENFLKDDGLFMFEAKMENAIDRANGGAHPRTIERVPAGALFDFEIVYQIWTHQDESGTESLYNFDDDIRNLYTLLRLIEQDGLGGSISRGYGNVQFELSGSKSIIFKTDGSSIPLYTNTENNYYTTSIETLNFTAISNYLLGAA